MGQNPGLAYSLLDYTNTCPTLVANFLLASSAEYTSLVLDLGTRVAETVGFRWPHYLAFRTLKENTQDFSSSSDFLEQAERNGARLDEVAVQSSLLTSVQKLRREISSRKFRDGNFQHIVDLSQFRDKSFSQYEGDGVLEGILGVFGLLESPGFFVEFGTQFGEECSTRNFRVRYGWKGVSFDAGFANSYFNLRKEFMREATIEIIFAKNFVPNSFDLLVIDIDGQDIHVWQALRSFRAKVVQIEFDRTQNPEISDFFVPRDADFQWSGFGPTGSALRPLVEVGNRMNYTLVGIDVGNLFFVANEILGNKHFVHMQDPVQMYRYYLPVELQAH